MSSKPPQFFVDHKRGEVNELKAILRNPKLDKDPTKKREIIKKVIAYMTLGIDVSRIFSEMVMAANTKDMVQKKMVYHYLCTYAEQKADLALLVINTLQTDCRDEDPMVRGLALRSLCSLKLPNLSEYVLMPIRKRLNDPSAYVRKTAVVGVAKLFRFSPEAVKGSDLVDVLYNMLRDKDADVIANVMCCLNEILYKEGGMAINSQIVLYLLNRVREFNEWAQCTLLDVVSRYTPADDGQMFDIMNLLEDRLRHSNSGVVLATTKVFLNFTQNHPQVHQEVFKRLKAPLLTLMGGSSFELAYTVLKHISLLVARAPGVFDDSFKHFFCRFNDPACVKLIKLEILIRLANHGNSSEVLNELAEYITDESRDIARASIKGVADVAIRCEGAADEAIEHLLSFLDLHMEYVSAQTCVVLKNLLRKYPERYEEVVPSLRKCLKTIEDADGKVAVIWMIGEYGDSIQDAPYLLEPLIDAFDEEPSNEVRSELLCSAMKVFFKRPPEMRAMLGRLLSAAVADTQKVDVRDRAMLYYRLLQINVQEAARVVACPKVIVNTFAESEDTELQDKVFKEFNSLSVIFNMPSELFVNAKKNADPDDDSDEEEEEAQQTMQGGSATAAYDMAAASSPAAAAPTQQSGDIMGDLLDFGSPAVAAPAPAPVGLQLMPNPVCDPATFQGKWEALAREGKSTPFNLEAGNVAGGAPSIEQACTAQGLRTMASGAVGAVLKFYFFAQDQTGYYFIEANVDTQSRQVSGEARADEPGNLPLLINLFQDALSSL